MNRSQTVIGFVNAAHFIDHYAMLIFAAAVVVMGPALNIPYAQLLPYATPGFIAFGAGSLLTGWLGDRWSRRHMMAVYFVGIGAAMTTVGFAQTPLHLGIALFLVGLFASIYHPVGTAMIVSYAEKGLGREIGLNGVWGNLGVASSALITGVMVEFVGWRWSFILPGVVSMAVGFAFMRSVVHEVRTGHKTQAAQARISKDAMKRVLLVLVLAVVGISTTFNAVTVALPKLFAERLSELTTSPGVVGLIAAGVYVFGAMTQYTVGAILDRQPLKSVFIPLSAGMIPLLYITGSTSGLPLIAVSILLIMGVFGQVTVSDAMVGKYTSDEWRGRAYSIRYFLGFTAAGLSVNLVAGLYNWGGFALMLHVLAAAYFAVLLGAVLFPNEERRSMVPAPQPGE